MDNRRYKQVKVTVDPAIAFHFKKACGSLGVSMASVLSQFMVDYSKMPIYPNPSPDYSTRKQRRAAIHTIARQLGEVKDWEERYRDNIPENLQGSMVYERADELVSLLDEVTDLLGSF
jgi:hypothetical protein